MSEKIVFKGNSRVEGEKVSLGKSFKIGTNTSIRGKQIQIEDDVTIGSNTMISADHLSIGFGSRIEDNCKILLTGQDSKFSIGDNCFIGHDSKIIVPSFEAGDYVSLHNHLLVNGYKPCNLGHNVWIGQNCILNSTDRLTIGNGVGIGTYSCVWTHGFYGELIEGCTIFKIAPVIIEDDVWLIGSFNIISPGITVGKRSVILTGSVVTRDVPPYACVAGNPAKDITEKLHPYKQLTVEEKYEMMKSFMKEFVTTAKASKLTELRNGWHVEEDHQSYDIIFLEEANDQLITEESKRIIFTKKNVTSKRYSETTIFDLSNKTYTKKRTEIEIRVMKFLLPTKARFLPLTAT
jgi:acetyltransferase-like isoleucine patch superfamily enzyme